MACTYRANSVSRLWSTFSLRDCAYRIMFLMTVNLHDVFAFYALLNCSTRGSIEYHKVIEILWKRLEICSIDIDSINILSTVL